PPQCSHSVSKHSAKSRGASTTAPGRNGAHGPTFRWSRARRGTGQGLPAPVLSKLRRIGELAEGRHLAAPHREHMCPLCVDRPAGLAQHPGVVAEHQHHIADSVKITRREAYPLLVLADLLEEVAHRSWPLTGTEQRIILLAADNLPGRIRRDGVDDRGDVAPAEGGVEASHKRDIGCGHSYLQGSVALRYGDRTDPDAGVS